MRKGVNSIILQAMTVEVTNYTKKDVVEVSLFVSQLL